MQHLKEFEIFEAFLTNHFVDRFELRAKDIRFKSGVEGLSEDEISFVRTKILGIWENCKKNLEKYDLEWNRGYRDRGYVFNFGDIVIKKGDQYLYPVMEVPDGKSLNEFKSGSVMCAICWDRSIVTLLIFPRKCKYTHISSSCKDPLNFDFVYDQFKRDKVNSLRMENRPGDPFTIELAPLVDELGKDVWKIPKVHVITLQTDDSKKILDKSEKDLDLLRRVKGFSTIKKITPDKNISFVVRRDGIASYTTRYIKSHRNIGSPKNFIVEVMLSSESGGPASSKKSFVKDDQILIKIGSLTKNPDDILALELGYTHYLAEIQRYSINREKEGSFVCNIIKPVIYNPS